MISSRCEAEKPTGIKVNQHELSSSRGHDCPLTWRLNNYFLKQPDWGGGNSACPEACLHSISCWLILLVRLHSTFTCFFQPPTPSSFGVIAIRVTVSIQNVSADQKTCLLLVHCLQNCVKNVKFLKTKQKVHIAVPIILCICAHRELRLAELVEHQTRDQKVVSSDPCWSNGRIFFSKVNLLS